MKELEMSFEEAVNKLDEIANELESGNLGLDDSIKKFEEGMIISKKCSSMLENAEKKITMIIDNEGKIEEKDFIPSDE